MNAKKVWFVTGASKGLGFELINSLLQQGYNVIATSRDAEKLSNLQKENPNLLAITMEVTDEQSVQDAMQKGIHHFGKIDIVVNNAGYGLLGTLEEFTMTEIRNCFDVNVFGVINVSKAILPYFRQQNSGTIINIASVSGSVSATSTGIYSATKSAVLQISEALSSEVEEFGIKVIAVCPGGFRTDFLDKSSLVTAKHEMDEYKAVRSIIARFGELNKNQGGNPKKIADVFIQLTEMKNPPTRIYLGSDALRMMDKKVDNIISSLKQNQELSISTDNY